MSPHPPHHPADAAQADTDEIEGVMPPGRPHHTTAVSEPSPSYRSHEIIGLIGLLISLLGIVGHAYVLDDHVKQLDRARDAEQAQHEAYEARMRSIETTAIGDRAAADKREALIEQQLGEITTRLDAIKVGVEQLQHHH